MADINTKMQDFYRKGRSDAVTDCDQFLRLVAQRFGNIKLDTGHTMQQFLDLVAQQMTTQLGGKPKP